MYVLVLLKIRMLKGQVNSTALALLLDTPPTEACLWSLAALLLIPHPAKEYFGRPQGSAEVILLWKSGIEFQAAGFRLSQS